MKTRRAERTASAEPCCTRAWRTSRWHRCGVPSAAAPAAAPSGAVGDLGQRPSARAAPTTRRHQHRAAGQVVEALDRPRRATGWPRGRRAVAGARARPTAQGEARLGACVLSERTRRRGGGESLRLLHPLEHQYTAGGDERTQRRRHLLHFPDRGGDAGPDGIDIRRASASDSFASSSAPRSPALRRRRGRPEAVASLAARAGSTDAVRGHVGQQIEFAAARRDGAARLHDPSDAELLTPAGASGRPAKAATAAASWRRRRRRRRAACAPRRRNRGRVPRATAAAS